MSKRFRLLIILILVGIATVFFFPTIRWYLLVTPAEKLLATSSNEQIRRYAEKQASVAVEEIKESINKLFDVNDLKDPVKLLKELKEGKSDIAKLIKEKFSDEGKGLINSYTEKMELTDSQKALIVKELNQIIQGKLIYDEDVFKSVKLSEPTKNLAEEVSKGNIKMRESVINRFLLDEAFPNDLHPIYLDKKYSYLNPKVRDYYRSIKLKAPSRMSVKAVLNSFADEREMLDAVEEHFRNMIFSIKDVRDHSVQLGLDLMGGINVTAQAQFNALPKERKINSQKDREDAMQQALEVLNSRIDKFGITEPEIRREGTDQITISLPGLADPERIKSIILGKGRLNFHIVDSEGQQKFNEYYNAHPGDFLKPGDKLELKDPNILPKGTVLREVVEKDKYGVDQRTGFAILKEEIGLEGNYISNASVQTDPTSLQPTVVFQLDKKGAEIFDKLTNENVKKTLAVVLDDKVKFQANISERISGGSVRVSGFGLSTQEATDLARVLKTGALPVPLEIISQEAVGATLGAEGIRVGATAALLGILLVIVFMLIYYRGSGAIASLALVLNMFFMIAILSVFHFTLTLPSIAGFILNVGMAVDANVIIFERIKEEYKLGKSRKAAIKAGFSKAFSTIMDSNLTTVIAALALAYFGKGPIKGFAVVLVTGIVSSMFTAMFVSRLLFDFITDVMKSTKISIGWRVAE